MLNSNAARKAAWIIGAALFVVGSTAFAHTTIRSQATESTTEDNAIKIGHGCTTADGASHLPVVATSVVFPSDAPELSASDGSMIGDLSQVIEQGTIAGLARAVQDRSIFRAQQAKFDSLENQIGFSGSQGSLNPELPGRMPFQFTAPRFQPTTCARRLLIRVAIADVCVLGAGVADSVQLGKVNMWIPDNGSQFSALGGRLGIDGIGAPATLTVNRNLTANPLAPACGAGIDVTVTPSAADVNANLPIPGVWP